MASLIEFEYTIDAATNNSNLLAEVGYDLRKFINKHPGSTMSYGSELRPLDQIGPLLTHHPSFERFKRNHAHGIDYPLEPLPEEERIAMLQNTIERGNHKSVLSEEECRTSPNSWSKTLNCDTGYPSQ